LAAGLIDRAATRTRRITARALIGLVRAYQWALSPFLGMNCRFEPSCSAYAVDAIDRFGPLRGTGLAIRRILRCHPWGASGYDPVPEPPPRDEARG
jgi:putative membrane protein insertion efficiency factor